MKNCLTTRTIMPVALTTFAMLVMAVSGLSSPVEDAARLFFRNPVYSRFDISPDGSHLSMIRHVEDSDVLATLELSTNQIRMLRANVGEEVSRHAWIDGDHLVAQMGRWNIYYAGIYVMDENLHTHHSLTHFQFSDLHNRLIADEMYTLIDPLPQVPHKVLLADRTISKAFPDVVFYDQEYETFRSREKNGDRTSEWHCDRTGIIRIVGRMIQPGGVSYFHRETVDAPWSPLNLPKDSSILGFTHDGKGIFISYQSDSGGRCFQPYSLSSEKLVGKPVKHPVYVCDPGIINDRESGIMVGAVFDFDKPVVTYYDPSYRKIHDTITGIFPGSVCRILGVTESGSVIFETKSDRQPARIFELDPLAEPKVRLLLSQADWIEKDMCQSMQAISFTARDDTILHGYLTRSRLAPDKKGPMVLLVHGGPWSRDRWQYDAEVQFLAALGFHVLQVNYRGSSGFHPEYSLDNLKDICPLSVKDVADGARWAIQEGLADPERMAILGGSFGGYVALASTAFEPDLYKVAIGYAGVYNYDQQLKDSLRNEPFLSRWLEPFVGDIKEHPEMYEDLSPVNFADRITARVLLIHGGADSRVSDNQCREMSEALKAAGRKPQVHINRWGIHGLPNENERIEYGILVGNFLNDNL